MLFVFLYVCVLCLACEIVCSVQSWGCDSMTNIKRAPTPARRKQTTTRFRTKSGSSRLPPSPHMAYGYRARSRPPATTLHTEGG